MSNSLYPDQTGHFVWPDLGPISVIFLAVKPTPVTGIVPKAKKYGFFPQLKEKKFPFPIFKIGQHIKAIASRKATYSQFKFDTKIFIVIGVGA